MAKPNDDPAHRSWSRRFLEFWTTFTGLITGLTALLAATAALLTALRSDQAPHSTSVAEQPSVKVGAIYPLTGSDESAGNDTYRGVMLAAKYINKPGPDLGLPLPRGKGLPGLKGARIELVRRDSRSSRCTPYSLVPRLVKKRHVSAVIGAYASTVTLAALRVADRLHVPLVNESSTAPTLTLDDKRRGPPHTPCPERHAERDRTPSPWYFSVGPNDVQAADVFLPFLREMKSRRHRVSKIAILHEDHDVFGNDALGVTKHRIADELNAKVEDFGYHRRPSSRGVDYGEKCSYEENAILREFKRGKPGKREDLITRIAQFVPDVIIAASYTADAILLVQAMKKRSYTPPALLAYGAGFGSRDFRTRALRGRCRLPAADPYSVITRVSWSPKIKNPTPVASRVAALFEKEYPKRKMTDNSARGFTAMMALAQAVNDGGSRNRDDIRAALEDLQVPAGKTIMPWAGIDFYDDRGETVGQNVRATFVLEQTRSDGSVVVVYPPDRRLPNELAIWPGELAQRPPEPAQGP